MKKTIMLSKFISMLGAGTITIAVVAILLMSDSVIAGLFLNQNAVAAVNVIVPLYSFAAFIGTIISLGIPILYEREIGKFEKQKANQIFGMGVILAVTLGVLMLIFCFLLGDSFFDFIGISDSVRAYAKDYFFWYQFTILLLPFNALFSEMVYADGDEIITTVAGLSQLIGNIILSIALVKPMGIAGIGLGSFIGTAMSVLVCFIHVFKKSNTLKFTPWFSFEKLWDIIKMSMIDSCAYLFIALFITVVERYIVHKFGEPFLIICVMLNFVREFQICFDGIGAAMTPIVNIYLSEGVSQGVKYIMGIAQKFAVIEGVIFSAVIFLLAPLLPNIYQIVNDDMIAVAVSGARIVGLGSVFVGLVYLSTSYYLLKGKILLGVAECGLRDFFCPTLGAIIGGLFGLNGVFWGITISQIVAYAVSELIVYCSFGKENYPLLLASDQNMKESYNYDFSLTEEEIIATQQNVGEKLRTIECSEKTVKLAELVFEEIFFLIKEKNVGKNLLAQCTIIPDDNEIHMITRDNGEIFDLIKDDIDIDSFRAYVTNSLVTQKAKSKKNQVTVSYNRNLITIPREWS